MDNDTQHTELSFRNYLDNVIYRESMDSHRKLEAGLNPLRLGADEKKLRVKKT